METRHIVDEFLRIAMAHPHIAFTLHHNGIELFHLREGNLRQRVVGILGNSYNEKLVPVEENTTVTKIIGFIGKPETARKLRGEQYLFVNNRFIKSNYLHHAILAAYDQLIPSDVHPFYVLFLDIAPSRIDVNVHPTKQEIKFEDERIIYTFVNTSVKHALGKFSVTPTLDFTRETAFDHYDAFKNPATAQNTIISNESSGLKQHTSFTIRTEKPSSPEQWKQLYEGLKTEKPAVYTIPSRWENPQDKTTLVQSEGFGEEVTPVFQLHDHFIVSQIKSGFILVDQQAAHERILYEKYSRHLNGLPNNTQPQLFPLTMNVSNADALVVTSLLPEIKLLGFDLHPFGGSSFVLHGVPPEVMAGQEVQTLEKIIDDFKQNEQALKHDRREQLAISMATLNSIKPGKTMDEKECRALLDQLFASENPYYAPDGRPTFITYHLRDLEKEFAKK